MTEIKISLSCVLMYTQRRVEMPQKFGCVESLCATLYLTDIEKFNTLHYVIYIQNYCVINELPHKNY